MDAVRDAHATLSALYGNPIDAVEYADGDLLREVTALLDTGGRNLRAALAMIDTVPR